MAKGIERWTDKDGDPLDIGQVFLPDSNGDVPIVKIRTSPNGFFPDDLKTLDEIIEYLIACRPIYEKREQGGS